MSLSSRNTSTWDTSWVILIVIAVGSLIMVSVTQKSPENRVHGCNYLDQL